MASPSGGCSSSTRPPRSANALAAASVMRRTSGSTGAPPRSGLHATRNPRAPPSTARAKSSPVAGSERGSRSSAPTHADRSSAASATVRVIGPVWEKLVHPFSAGHRGTRPRLALKPTTPHTAAGIRIEPARSLPSASGPSPAATAAAAPPLEPPAIRSRCHGLRVCPKIRLSVTPLHPNSGVFVLPTTTAPARRARSTTIASSSGTWCSKIRDPIVVRIPAVAVRSLKEIGRPCSTPAPSPRSTAASAAVASARARSAATVQ